MTARIRYSLRLVFLGLTIAAVLLTLWSNAAKGQRQTVAEIRALGGAVAKPHLDLPAFQDLDFRRLVAAGDFSFLDRLGIFKDRKRGLAPHKFTPMLGVRCTRAASHVLDGG